MGLSAIGNPCTRYLQYSLHNAFKQKISYRMQRLFDLGHILEEYIVDNLISAGYPVTDQQAEIPGAYGHWAGHIDGVIMVDGKRYLLEIKTHNQKSFNDLTKKRVLKSKPVHYDQMQRYMYGLRPNNPSLHNQVDAAIYVAYSKNTSTYHIEEVPYDADRVADLQKKELHVMIADKLDRRIGNNSSSWYECRFCNAKDACFKGIIEKNCRTCTSVEMLEGGKWKCTKKDKMLDYEFQMMEHDCYVVNPFFEL